jgi:hypothetical protein
MSDTFFSSFLMVDRPLAPVARSRAPGDAKEQERPNRSEKNAREVFVTAFLRALQEVTPGATASAATSLGSRISRPPQLILHSGIPSFSS